MSRWSGGQWSGEGREGDYGEGGGERVYRVIGVKVRLGMLELIT